MDKYYHTSGFRLAPVALFAMFLVLFTFFSSSAYADGGHECGGMVFETPLSGEIPHDLAPGTYFLEDDCYILRHVDIRGEVSICLNGHSVEVQGATTFHPREGGVLNFYDCTGEGIVGYVGGWMNNHPLTLDEGGIVNIYGGYFYAKTNSNCINSEGTVNIYGGIVESSTDGYCAVRNHGCLNIYGGTVIGCDSVWQRDGGAINLAGDSFVLRAKGDTLRYIWDQNTLFEVTTPLYMWRTAEDGEFVSSEDAAYKYVNGTTYLEFAPLRAALKLDYAGGSGQTELTEYTCGEVTALPTDAVREGWTFEGWRDANGEVVAEVPAEARGEQSFTAVWRENPVSTAAPEPPETASAPVKVEKAPHMLAVFIVIGIVLVGAEVALSIKKN